MKKYWTYFKQRLQVRLAYKFHVIIEFLTSLIPLALKVVIWRAVLLNTGDVRGYGLNEFLVYYVLTLGVSFFYRTTVFYLVQRGVREGGFSGMLVKPWSFIGFMFTDTFSDLVNKLLTRGPIFLIMILAVSRIRSGLDIVWFDIPILLTYLMLYFVFTFFWELIFVQLIFIAKSGSGIHGTLYNLRQLLSGKMLPVDVLPGWLSGALLFLPFANGFFLPINFMMGEVSYGELGVGALKLIGYLIVVLLFLRITWPKIIKNYAGVGI